MSDQAQRPALLVYSSLFPSPVQPNAGVFVRERMFRVGAHLPIVVVAPTPWFPFQSVLRMFRPHFRPMPPAHQQQDGVDVLYPRYFSIPGVFKQWDGLFMALSTYAMVKRLHQAGRVDIIDAHFAYPDGYAATLLGRWLKVPVAITLRGTEARHARTPALVGPLKKALQGATRLIAVSSELLRVAVQLGADPARALVVGNGVDISKFQPHSKDQARAKLGIAPHARVLISVGGLVERKGFHRVIPLLPELLKTYPDLVYLIVGGASAEGDNRAELEKMVADLLALIRLQAPTPDTPAAAVIGHDWGGAIAWTLASMAPQSLQRLLILNAPHTATFVRDLKRCPAQQAASAYMNDLRAPGAEEALSAHDHAGLLALIERFGAGGPYLFPIPTSLTARVGQFWR